MANSIRKQVLDGIINALKASTGIQTVVDRLENWWDKNNSEFPCVTVLDRDSNISRLAFESTANDRLAEMQVLTRGYVHDFNSNTAKKRTDLIKDIQTTLEAGTTTLNALVFDIMDMTIETDDGVMDNYSVFDIIWKVEYHYNHATP